MSYDFARFLNMRSAINPVIAPDGKRVAFLSDISGNYQVWSVGLKGSGEQDRALQLTFFPDKVWELHGAGAAPHLVAVSDEGGNERQQFYLVDGYGLDGDGRESHQVRRLTRNLDAIHRFGDFSADGGRIAYTSNARNKVDFDYYLMDIATGEETLLLEAQGNRRIEAWSPDGRYLLVADEEGSLKVELYLFDLKTRTERHLTQGKEPARYSNIKWNQAGVFLLSDLTDDRGALCRLNLETGGLEELFNFEHLAQGPVNGEVELLAVAQDGDNMAYTITKDAGNRLFLLSLSTGKVRRVENLPGGYVQHLSFAHEGESLIMDLQTPSLNPDIWAVTVADASCRRITLSNRAGIPVSACIEPENVEFTTFDELSIPALYYRPRGGAPEGGFPCILYVHGGPASMIRPDFDVRFQYFLNRGYAILAPNVRGSYGYGRRYTALDEIELRMDSVADLKYAVLWLHGREEINNARIAIYGRSYGGYMVLSGMTEYPELFAAGIDVVGLVNMVTFLERTGAYRRAHREAEYGSLEHHRDLLKNISPIHKVDRVKAPILVMAGDNDPRVPLFESQQVAEKVAAGGGVVEFVHYADEGHKFSKLHNRIDCFTRMADFLDRYL